MEDMNQQSQQVRTEDDDKKFPLSGYRRENYEETDPSDCIQQGEWTKWCLERCTEEQKRAYFELREMVDAAGLTYLSLNHVLRYVKSFNWSVPEAYQRLVTTEKWRKDRRFFDIDRNEILAELQMRAMQIYGHDIRGRPLIWLKA